MLKVRLLEMLNDAKTDLLMLKDGLEEEPERFLTYYGSIVHVLSLAEEYIERQKAKGGDNG